MMRRRTDIRKQALVGVQDGLDLLERLLAHLPVGVVAARRHAGGQELLEIDARKQVVDGRRGRLALAALRRRDGSIGARPRRRRRRLAVHLGELGLDRGQQRRIEIRHERLDVRADVELDRHERLGRARPHGGIGALEARLEVLDQLAHGDALEAEVANRGLDPGDRVGLRLGRLELGEGIVR